MTKPFPLQPLLNLALTKNDEAIRRLGQLNKQEHDTKNQLKTLQEYRREYQTRMQATTQQGMDPTLLRNFQQFIYKLDAAIIQQQKAVELSMHSTQTGRHDFSNTQRKLKSFDTLQQRHIETEQKREAKLELRAMDEHTGRMSAYKMLKPEKE